MSDEYERCRRCLHFVDLNACEGEDLAEYIHLEDGETDFTHDAEPSGIIMSLEKWQEIRSELFPYSGETDEEFLARRKREGHHHAKP